MGLGGGGGGGCNPTNGSNVALPSTSFANFGVVDVSMSGEVTSWGAARTRSGIVENAPTARSGSVPRAVAGVTSFDDCLDMRASAGASVAHQTTAVSTELTPKKPHRRRRTPKYPACVDLLCVKACYSIHAHEASAATAVAATEAPNRLGRLLQQGSSLLELELNWSPMPATSET